MNLQKWIAYNYLLVLLACSNYTVFSQTTNTIASDEKLVEQALIFGQQITDNCSRAISHDGSKMAIVNAYKLQIWDLSTKRMILEEPFEGNVGSPSQCAFSASGQQVAIYAVDDFFAVYDINTRSYTAQVSQVSYASENLKHAIQTGSYKASVFAMDDPEDILFQTPSRNLASVAFSSNERYLLACDNNGFTQVIDLEKRAAVFADTLTLPRLRTVAISNDGRRFGGVARPPDREAFIAEVRGQESVVIKRTQLSENVRGEDLFIKLSSNGRYLCVTSSEGYDNIFKVYDYNNELAVLFEDAAVSRLPESPMVIDSTYISYYDKRPYYDSEPYAKIVLDQESLQVLDTLVYPDRLALFDPAHRPIDVLRDGRFLKFFNDAKGTVDTLRWGMLVNTDWSSSNRIGPNLMVREKGLALPDFDLMNLAPMNAQDSIKKYKGTDRVAIAPRVEFDTSDVVRPDYVPMPRPKRYRKWEFSPRWKYRITNAGIVSWRDGRKVMDVPFLGRRPLEWKTIYTYEEDRVLFYHSGTKRVIVVDLINGQVLMDEQYSFSARHLRFSPTGTFFVLAGYNLSTLMVVPIDGEEVNFDLEQFYKEGASISGIQISPDGKWLQLCAYSDSSRGNKATIWSIESGELLYQADDYLILIDHPTDVLHWSKEMSLTDSLKRVSTVTGQVRWSIPFEGEYYGLRAPVGASYLAYIKDGVYHCLMDLTTGEELWQMGIGSYVVSEIYFVKSSRYPLVQTNYDPFLQRFHYQENSTNQTVYPDPESLRDSSMYLQRITRKVLGRE